MTSTLDKVKELETYVDEIDHKEERIYSYDWRDLHNDLEKGIKAGSYGWNNACYLALAEVRANVNLDDFHGKRTKDEFYIPEIKELLDSKQTQKEWKRIVTFDPLGMTATNPTIACTTAMLNITELEDLTKDGRIVNSDGSINAIKSAVYYAWNLPSLSKRLNMSLSEMRNALYKYTNDKRLLNKNIKAFLPQLGGFTVYIFGDPRKLLSKKTEITVRVHDECNGSDVFGTDICTCRPYLIFALKLCIETAQRGGVGVIVYFRKEGRSLGEVTKYRVYNARKNQKGGDRSEKYFFQTESIAGIRDARFQGMMPDALNWLGITRIDWLLSMSSEKYEAIVNGGIRVEQRVPLPNMYVPKHAFVELQAKIMSGYHTDEIKSNEVIEELRDLRSIRKQCNRIFDLGVNKKLYYFNINLKNLDKCGDYVIKVIKRRYPNLNIPMHSRFRHYPHKTYNEILSLWKKNEISNEEQTRRLIDLTTISVLLDAGAGPTWKYRDIDGNISFRSEGLAVASVEMFLNGTFSSDSAIKTRVNSLGLLSLKLENFKRSLQVTKSNKLFGLEGRFNLLRRLGKALAMDSNNKYFGREIHRPGNILDYLLKYCNKNKVVSVRVLWEAIIVGLESIWPEKLSGIRKGDVWTHNCLKIIGKPGSDLVPFHKLQQWLCYSLMEALKLYGIKFTDETDMTGLAEYRNGGLFIDSNVININKNKVDSELSYDVGSELVVEWRALTVICLDKLHDIVCKKLNKSKEELTLTNLLEGGSWQAGREMAANLRKNGTPPIKIRSDGTVF